MSKLTVQIPAELNKQLRGFCKQQNRSPSQVVRDSLSRYLATERFRSLRRKTLPFAEAQGLLTDEDVFKSIS